MSNSSRINRKFERMFPNATKPGDKIVSQNIQQTDCYTMLPPDVTLKDIKEIRNYFGEHDVTLFEHRAFSILSRLINHLEASGGNIV